MQKCAPEITSTKTRKSKNPSQDVGSLSVGGSWPHLHSPSPDAPLCSAKEPAAPPPPSTHTHTPANIHIRNIRYIFLFFLSFFPRGPCCTTLPLDSTDNSVHSAALHSIFKKQNKTCDSVPLAMKSIFYTYICVCVYIHIYVYIIHIYVYTYI